MTKDLIDYVIHLADDALILGHRNSEWCGHGPVLEQDIAITNISLDLVGQARNFYQYAATLINTPIEANKKEVTEDSLAYLRDTREFKNCLLVEQPNGDWAKTILRQFLFSNFQYYLYKQLQGSDLPEISAIAEKSLKEVSYHVRWSSEWVIRLGDGTAESRNRILQAIDELWMYTGELFEPASYEDASATGLVADLDLIKSQWTEKQKEIFAEAKLPSPENVFMQTGGKKGRHSEHLGFILADLQFMQRAYPNNEW